MDKDKYGQVIDNTRKVHLVGICRLLWGYIGKSSCIQCKKITY